jgi:hypothetical protein
MSDEIEITIADLSRVALEPGDILLIRSPKRLTLQSVDSLKKAIREGLPGHRVLVLEEGLDLAVIRPVGPAADDLLS